MRQLLVCLLLFFYNNPLFAQGCSDAGFCTMGAMKPNQRLSKNNLRLRSVEFTEYYGNKEALEVHFLSHILDVNVGLKKKTVFQAKFTYNQVYGILANTNGIGDISLSVTHLLFQNEKLQLSATVGGKIPTYPADKSKEGRPLPMYYQTSLGTYDLVGGVSIVSKHLLVAAGIQHPFNVVDNKFTWGAWETSPLFKDANQYPVSNKLVRGTDVMFRTEGNISYYRFNFSLGFLLINRLNKDIIDSPRTGKSVEVPGSDGNANTLLSSVSYHLDAKSTLKLIWGHQLIKRVTNPDGLYRDNVVTATYQFRF
jgi:hypothetical protein